LYAFIDPEANVTQLANQNQCMYLFNHVLQNEDYFLGGKGLGSNRVVIQGPEIVALIKLCQQNVPDITQSCTLRRKQGCQFFMGATYQNRKYVPNNHKNTKWPQNM
jgi:hypothetical protein